MKEERIKIEKKLLTSNPYFVTTSPSKSGSACHYPFKKIQLNALKKKLFQELLRQAYPTFTQNSMVSLDLIVSNYGSFVED